MAKRTRTARGKTRHKWEKSPRQKGKVSIRKFLQKFKEGDKVTLLAESAYQKGIYFRRFHGRIGIVTGKQGTCYYIDIKDINKAKRVLVHPVHLKRLENAKARIN